MAVDNMLVFLWWLAVAVGLARARIRNCGFFQFDAFLLFRCCKMRSLLLDRPENLL